MSETSNLLIEAGLSEEQSLTYEALLDKGPQRASNLSDWTGIMRGLTYKVLEQLENMGLIEKKGGKGSVAVFAAGHPSLLMGMIERREKEIALAKDMLGHSVGTLVSKYNLIAGKPNLQFYEGREAIERITGDMPKNEKIIRQFMDISLAMNQFPEDTIGHLKKRVNAGISKKMILSDNEYNIEYAHKGSELTEFKIAKNVQTFPTAILAYDDKVTMLTLTPQKTVGVVIEDKEIADTLKIIFDGWWANSGNTITPLEPSA